MHCCALHAAIFSVEQFFVRYRSKRWSVALHHIIAMPPAAPYDGAQMPIHPMR